MSFDSNSTLGFKTRSRWSRMAVSSLFWLGLTVISVIFVAALGALTVPLG